MKKIILAVVLSAFSFSAAAYACDGMKMKGHDKGEKSDTQAKKKIPTLRRPGDPDPNAPAPVKKK